MVPKAKLQEMFVSLGYQQVWVHKQSGNIIFQANTDEAAIQRGVEKKLYDFLGKDISVFVRSLPYLQMLIESAPFRNVDSANASCLVTFFRTEPIKPSMPLPIAIPKTKAKIIKIDKTEAYSLTYGSGEGAAPNPFLEKLLKIQATTRNWNTLKEIVQLTEQKLL
jgi:uncharacterized protein (DUF1697 family)